MALKKQLSVMVVNEIGEGAKLCGILKEAGINIEAISVWEYTEGSVVRMVVNDDKKAARVLRESLCVLYWPWCWTMRRGRSARLWDGWRKIIATSTTAMARWHRVLGKLCLFWPWMTRSGQIYSSAARIERSSLLPRHGGRIPFGRGLSRCPEDPGLARG